MAATLPPGRPRDDKATSAILEATLRNLAQFGYAGISLDTIAAEAGVTKPTLYRRWASKADLVTAAMSEWRNRSMPEQTGDFEADLEANLRQMGRLLSQPLALAMIAALLLEERTKPELMDLYRERNIGPRQQALRKILLAAKRENALKPDLDMNTVMAMVMGAYYWQLISGEPIPAKWPREILKVVMQPPKVRK
jgi:AcrR family transcriptional regulator